MHPTYDPSALSDDELLEKLQKLYSSIGKEQDHGHNSMVFNIRVMIETLEAEKEQRLVKAQTEELRKKGIDPDEPIDIGTISDYPNNNEET